MSFEDELKQRANAAIDLAAERLWQASLDIHAHPELGFAEVHAADLLGELLRNAGLTVERGIGGMSTAFRAAIPGGAERPVIAILAEMDALPDIGHACGHNLIGTAAIGAGVGLAAVAAALPGSALILGCPAEESAVDGAGGKVRFVAAGAFAGVDAALMVHPGTLDFVSLSGSLAACGREFEFHGRSAHAALAPEDGVNALDAVLATFHSINALRQHLRGDVRVHGVITHGGSSPNVVPDYAACRFRIRADDRCYLAEVTEKVTNCARAGAVATGAELIVHEYAPMYEEIRPNQVLGEVFSRNLAATGRPMAARPKSERKASSDFGNVSQVVPSVTATVAIAAEGVAPHTPAFAAAAIAAPARQMLLDSAKALAGTAIELLLRPDLLAAAQAEFRSRAGTPNGR